MQGEKLPKAIGERKNGKGDAGPTYIGSYREKAKALSIGTAFALQKVNEYPATCTSGKQFYFRG